MMGEELFDRKTLDPDATGSGDNPGRFQNQSLDSWQVAGFCLLFCVLLPAVLRVKTQDGDDSLNLTLLSAPLLAWLLVPRPRTDDLFDESCRRWSTIADVLDLVILWTWQLTFLTPLFAVGRCVETLLNCAL